MVLLRNITSSLPPILTSAKYDQQKSMKEWYFQVATSPFYYVDKVKAFSQVAEVMFRGVARNLGKGVLDYAREVHVQT